MGILILLFVAYQLWGTGIYTARQQNKLENQFEQPCEQPGAARRPDFPVDRATRPTGHHDGHRARSRRRPREPPIAAPDTDAVARIVIPKIGVD